MKIRIATACALIALLTLPLAHARDDRLKMSIQDAMGTVDAKVKLGTDVKFFFGSQATPEPAQTFSTVTFNKKPNAGNKSDAEGCLRAFLSAMIAMKDQALREGGNAVINIHSVYKDQTFESATEYECGTGKIGGGVALRGTIVKL